MSTQITRRLNNHMNDPLDDALGLPAIPKEKKEIVIHDEPLDYATARERAIRLATKAEHALDSLLEIADISQHPRAYEVAANLIKTGLEANRDLLVLKKMNQEIGGSGVNPTVINNTIIMTPDEMLKKIRNHMSKDDDKNLITHE